MRMFEISAVRRSPLAASRKNREQSLWRGLTAFTLAAFALLPVAFAESANLGRYFVHYKFPGLQSSNASIYVDSLDTPWPIVVDNLPGYMNGVPVPQNGPVDGVMKLALQRQNGGAVRFWGPLGMPCRVAPLVIPQATVAGTVFTETVEWRYVVPSLADCSEDSFGGARAPVRWVATDVSTVSAPLRRTARDGGQYDAAPMRVVRSTVPWITYHWGYRLGLVASTANVDPVRLAASIELAGWPTERLYALYNGVPDKSTDFELTTLPPPWIEDDVIEYVNRADFPNQPGGQYFYAVRAEDKALLDSQPKWQRSGKSFKSGGYVSVCRFYGGKNGGPNTHFYSANDQECDALKAAPQLAYEGQTFAVNSPLPAKNAEQSKPGALRDCPAQSKPLYRVYNNASASNGRWVSNHRYVTERGDVVAAISEGWADEGHVMCVPN